MKMKILTLVPLFIVATYAQEKASFIDVYHDDLCKILVETSNSIDNYFIEENSSISSTTHAKFSTSTALESHHNFEKDIRFRLRLNLPKIQKNLRLIFEDENNDDSLYDRTTLNDKELLERSYYLRLEYFRMIKDKLNIVAGTGLRIRQGNLVPYFNLRSRYDIYKEKKIESALYNRFRFYTDGEIEDIFEFNSLYTIDSFLYVMLRNQLSFSNINNLEQLYHDITVTKKLHNKRQLNIGVGVSSYLKNFKKYNVEYYHLHSLYHHLFYKDWIYYQVAPSVLWRESNNFNISYRLMLNFGIFFNKG